MTLALALAALLAQGATPAPAPLAPKATAAADAAPGDAASPKEGGVQDTFEQKCKFCHGVDGMGRTKKGKQLKAPDFTSAKWNKETTDEEIVEAIRNGVPKTKMPAFKTKLDDATIQALAVYVRKFGAHGGK